MCEIEPRRVNWVICLRVTPHPPPPPKLLSCSPVSSMRSPEPHSLFNLIQVPPSFVTFLHFLFNDTFILLGSIHLVLHQSRKRGHTKKRFVPSDLRYRGGWRPKIAANQRISDKWGLVSVYLLSAVFFPLLHVSNIKYITNKTNDAWLTN